MQKTIINIVRTWKILKPFHGYLIFLAGLLALSQAIGTAFTIVNANILTSLSEKEFSKLFIVLSVLAGLYVIEYLVEVLQDWVAVNKTDRTIQQYLQEYSLKRVLRLTISQHIEEHSAIKQVVISNGETAVENIITTLLFNVLQSVAMFVFSVGTLFYYDTRLGIIGLVVSTVIFTWIYRFTGYQQPFIEENQARWRENTKIKTEVFSHLPLVKYQAQEDFFLNKYITQRLVRVLETIKMYNVGVWHRAKRNALIETSSFLSAIYAIVLYMAGAIGLGTIYLVWNINSRLYWQLTTLSRDLRRLPVFFDDLEKYFNAIDKEPAFDEHGIKNIPKGDIIFSNVSFKYPKGNHNVYNSLSFTIHEGKKTAFIGPSGSGKSTIAKLLLRAYDYNSGSITYGGVELKSVDTNTLRHSVGYVEQHVDLLDDTIKENILFGVSNYNQKLAENNLEKTAQLARIDQFYHRLGEKKFETVVGERGIKLSGGERQRIGIARAIIKNPSLLIFDEATSSLDTENEKYVMEAIRQVSTGKTTIIIAHRLSTICDADKIIVMDKGSVVGEGTHNELMSSNPIYQNLVAHQLSA